MSQESNHSIPHTETMEIIERFKTLSLATMKSLRDRKISLQSLPNSSALSDAEATEYVLNHSSFFNFHLMEHVIHSLGTEEDNENLSKYKDHFAEYGKRGIPLDDSLCPLNSDHLIKLFLIVTPKQQFNVGDLHTFFDTFRTTVLKICPSSIFNLCHVEAINPGSLKLTILIPFFLIQEVFPLSTEQEEKMTIMGINHLWFIYQFHKEKNQVMQVTDEEGISDLSSNGLGILLSEVWEARTKWYNLGLALGLPSHTLDAIKNDYHDIAGNCFTEMLNQRLSSTPTLQWSHVISALRQAPVGFVNLANKLAESHIPELAESPPTMSHILLDEADQIQSRNPQAINCNGKDSDNEVADSKHKIRQELRKVKDCFMSLLSDIQDRLSKRVSTERIVTFVVTYARQFKGHRDSQQLTIAERDLKHIDNAFSTHDIFRVLSKYWSFLEHEMLVSLVHCLGGRRIRRKVKEYQKQLRKFLEKRKMLEFELPLRCFDDTYITELNETHEPIIVKLDLNDPSWDDIVHLKESICTILEVLPSALMICKVEDGCIKVTFYTPKLIAHEIFKKSLKVEQFKALTSTPVTTLSVTRETVIFTNKSYKDIDKEQETIEEIESLSCSTLTDTEDVLNEDLTESETDDHTVENGEQTTGTPPAANIQAIKSKAASTAGYSDSGRGTMTHSTIADEEEVDHTFNLDHDDLKIEPYLRMVDVDANKLLPSDHNKTLSLHHASFRGDLNKVRKLTEKQNYNPMQRDENGNTALHYAARGNHVNILKYFIQERGCNSACQNKIGFAPLHTAALCCCLEVIKYLTDEENMELLDADEEGYMPLHRACTGGDITVIRYLVNKMRENGTKTDDLVYSKTKSGDNPIHCASLKGNLEAVKFFISELNCNPNVKGQWDKTPLQCAAQGGHLDTVKYLVEDEKCEYSSENDTPLHLAAEHGHLQVLKYLTTVVQYNPKSRNADGKTSLSSAALNGHLNVVRFFTLDLKCDPNIPDDNGKLPIHAATENGHLEITKFFIEELACDPSKSMDKAEETPLHVAAKKGHLDLVKYLAEKMSSSLSKRNSNGEAPLNLAALYGRFDVLKYFISVLKCDPNTLGQYDRTPLHSAAQQGYLDIVKYLIEDQKCDPSICKGKDKVTPLHVAAKYGHLHVVKYLTQEHHCDPLRKNVADESSLICSARNGYMNILDYFIKELNIDPNAPGPRRRTALHFAAGSGHLDVVQYLIETCGCHPSTCENDDKVTPLHVAAEGGHLHIVKYLIDDQKCSPITRDKYPFVPLHYAAQHGRLEVVRYFIEDCKCLPSVSGYRESKPLDLACRYGHNHVVKYLSDKIAAIHNSA